VAVTFIGVVTDTTNNGNAATASGFDTPVTTGGGAGGSFAAGDMLIAVSSVFNRAAGDAAITDSNTNTWTEIANDATQTNRDRINWHIVTAADAALGASYTVNAAGTGNSADATGVVVGIWRGMDPAGPQTTTLLTNSTANINPSAIVPSKDNAEIVVAIAESIQWTGTAPANYSLTGTFSANDNNDAGGGFIRRLLTGGGGASEDPLALTSSACGWAAMTLALVPAAVAHQGNALLQASSSLASSATLLGVVATTFAGVSALTADLVVVPTILPITATLAGEGALVADALRWHDDGTVFAQVLTAYNNGWQGLTLRQRLGPDLLYAVPDGKVAVSFQFTAGTNGQIDAAWIGHAAGAGDAYDFDGNQVQLKFGGNNNVAVTAGTTISDTATFAYDATKPLIVSVAFNAAGVVNLAGYGG
jgi:hypothetical protein